MTINLFFVCFIKQNTLNINTARYVKIHHRDSSGRKSSFAQNKFRQTDRQKQRGRERKRSEEEVIVKF